MEASTVWMVHARTGLDGVKGRISLEEGHLIFRPERVGPGETRLPLRSIRRVRRAPGTPVLEVRVRSDRHPPVIGFYFIRPPSLVETYEGLNPFKRRSARNASIRTLRGANAFKKHEVRRWVAAIREELRR